MFAKEELFLNFLSEPQTQLVIPVYQRVYVWSEKQCRALWNDCMRAGADVESGAEHFIGTILFAEELALVGGRAEGDAAGSTEGGVPAGADGEDRIRQFAVIDGQQRCATITLLLLALRDYLAECDLAVDGLDACGLEERYLKTGSASESGSASEPGDASEPGAAGKLTLGRADQATLEALLTKGELPEEDELSQNIADNYALFRGLMDESFGSEEAQVLWRGLHRLTVISAQLEEGDEPQLIFESLNGKGLPLSTGDLIRNLLLADETLEDQERLFATYWAPIERLYAGEDGDVRLNAAIRGWLAVTAPKLSKGIKDDVYDTFKTYLREGGSRDLESTLIGLKGFCENFASKAQAAKRENAQTDWDTKRSGALISERKLFGD